MWDPVEPRLRWQKLLTDKKLYVTGLPNFRRVSVKHFTSSSTRAIGSRRSLPNWGRLSAMQGTTTIAGWKGCGSRFLLANCRQRSNMIQDLSCRGGYVVA